MATITGLTADRMLAIEAESIVDGEVVGDHLILTKHDGTQIDAGVVVGPPGLPGPGTNDLVFKIDSNGVLSWGDGVSIDTSLWRKEGNTLKSAGALELSSGLRLVSDIAAGYAGITFGSSYGVSLYRANGSTLQTDSSFGVGGGSIILGVLATNKPGIQFDNGGGGPFQIYGATDTGIAHFDNKNGYSPKFEFDVVGTRIFMIDNNSEQVKLTFGPTGDTNLYRLSAGVLKSDGGLELSDYFALRTDSGIIYFGSSLDVSLRRAGANLLKTDDDFEAASVKSGGMHVARTPLGSARHVESGSVPSGGGSVTFTDAFASTPAISIGQTNGGGVVGFTALTSTGATFASSTWSSYTAAGNWIAEGTD